VDGSPTVAKALAGVRDAGSAFAFIEWFTREWLVPIRDGDGCTADEVAAVEERLGLRLPALLTAFYRLLGWRRDLTSGQDSLISLNSLDVMDGALVYRIEAEGCASWGIRVADLELADPPAVYCEGLRNGKPWRPFMESFSQSAGSAGPAPCSGRTAGPGSGCSPRMRRASPASGMRCRETGWAP
jgi:hypothetical protein